MSSSVHESKTSLEAQHVEDASPRTPAPEEAVIVTEEDNKRILRKIDSVMLVIICWVYLLMILDKQVLSYSSVFGLQQDTGLVGNQYSNIGTIGYIAQLSWQPFSALLIIRVPFRILVPILVFCWGATLTGMAGAHNYAGLMGTRFTLGLFEAACLPVFTMMVSNWYRRAEQPIRIAAFYSMNGIGTIVGSGIVYGLGHVKNTTLHTYQIVFLFFGLITCITAPFLYWKLDNSPESARFLSPEDRIKAVARLRSNQAAHSNEGTFEIKWSHVIEIVTEPKTIGWMGMTFLLNLGASVSSVFGPLILNGLGYSSYLTSLLNMPFGALQFILILSASYAAYSFKVKGPIFFVMMLPTLAGVAMLWGLGRTHSDQAPLLVAYYLIAFLFAGNPLLVSWITANTAGQTKKSIILALYQASSSAGNIAGPQLFHSKDKPEYKPGLKATMASFIVLVVLILLQIGGLMVLNKLKERQRVANGKPAKLVDLSMTHHFAQDAGQTEVEAGVDGRERMTHAEKAAALDMTDRQNDEFQYVL